jgi:tRNA1Val (adenine37-N6)-methyltransferase
VFRFKQFSIDDKRSAMKVGTDGVLLGAWATCFPDKDGKMPRIVDIGCGSGLITLMMAQRFPSAQITGVDIDAFSIEDARDNVTASPFAEQIDIIHADIFTLPPAQGLVHYVCNPPFYTEDTVAPDLRRATARHHSALPLDSLVKYIKGSGLSIILPSQQESSFLSLCHSYGMHLNRICYVRTTEKKEPKRVMMEVTASAVEDVERTTLTLMSSDGKRSEEYASLCRDFYL